MYKIFKILGVGVVLFCFYLTSCWYPLSNIGDIDFDDYDDNDYIENTTTTYKPTTTVTYTDNNGIVISDDDYEPDDGYLSSTSLLVNTTQEHTISKNGDVDYFSFTVLKDNTYRITLYDIKGFEPELTLFNNNGISVIEMKNTGTYTDVFDWWGYDKDRNYNSDEKESIIFTADSATTLYISVKDVYDAHDKGSYKIILRNIVELKTITNLTAQPDASFFRINLNWLKIDGADGYNVYRGDNTEDFILLNSTTNNFYYDSSINSNQKYYYCIESYLSDTTSDKSNIANSIYTIAQPENLEAYPDPINFQINLEWDSLSNVDGYKVYRLDASSDTTADLNTYSFIGSTINTEYYDSTIQPNKTYYYYVVGFIGSKNGYRSETANSSFIWTNFRPTSEIINASEGLKNKIRVTLNKKYNNQNIVKYDVYRSDSNTEEPTGAAIYSFTNSDLVGEFYDDIPPLNEEYYYYCVKIVISIEGVETESKFSYYDSGVASN